MINVQSGLAAERPADPAVGDVYIETDTSTVSTCYTAGTWTPVVTKEHKELTGLEADDHTQYLNVARHDLAARHPSSIITGIQSGAVAQRPDNPAVGDVWIEHDPSKLYACFEAGEWTQFSPTTKIQSGPIAERPENPVKGDVYVETDTSTVSTCYTAGTWTPTAPKEHGELDLLDADDHQQYLTEERHDIAARHPASIVKWTQGGLDADKPDNPVVGDIWIATDTLKTYACFNSGSWLAFGTPTGPSPPTEDLLQIYFVTPQNVLHVEGTGDIVWTDLDLSTYVPAGAAGVLLNLLLFRGEAAARLQVRRKGHTGPTTHQVETTHNNSWIHNFVIVECNTNQAIQYKLDGQEEATSASLYIHLFGYTAI